MGEKQLRVDSYPGMGLDLKMAYRPWCGFRDPLKTFEKTFPFHSPPHSSYWLPTQNYSFSPELLICHLNESHPRKGAIFSHIRNLDVETPSLH